MDTFEYLYDAIIMQYLYGAYRTKAVTMATVELSETEELLRHNFR